MTGSHRRRVVLTGAWGGGKTKFVEELCADPRRARSILVLPEAAPLARRMGFDVQSEAFERYVFRLQHALEEAVDAPETESDSRIVIAHRGALDALAFWCYQGGAPAGFYQLIGSSHEAELARYDAVILLRSTAQGAPTVYEAYRRQCDRPSTEEAVRLESLLERAWQAHPRFFRVGNEEISWSQKSALARAILDARLPRPRPVSRRTLNTHLNQITYPSSHQYTVDRRGHVQPCTSGAARLREIERVLPEERWTSLIDVGCAKGMFLLWALRRFGLRRAIGVEAADDMVVACRQAVDLTNAPATILHGSLGSLYRALPAADLVFVLHCYHYLYFGSAFGTPGVPSHDHWFQILSQITSDTLVFANPLELEPDRMEEYRERGFTEQVIEGYNAEAILDSAGRYFELQPVPLGGERPYIIMRRIPG